MIVSSPLHRTLALALMAFAGTACSSPEEVLSFDPVNFQERTGVVFVAQNVVPDAVMEALFEGRVITDAAGCLRLDSPDPATVVWPRGFTMAATSDGMVVRDPAGRVVGQIGDSFRFGGGYVQSLHNVAMSAADRERAGAHCPGDYWVVGDVP